MVVQVIAMMMMMMVILSTSSPSCMLMVGTMTVPPSAMATSRLPPFLAPSPGITVQPPGSMASSPAPWQPCQPWPLQLCIQAVVGWATVCPCKQLVMPCKHVALLNNWSCRPGVYRCCKGPGKACPCIATWTRTWTAAWTTAWLKAWMTAGPKAWTAY